MFFAWRFFYDLKNPLPWESIWLSAEEFGLKKIGDKFLAKGVEYVFDYGTQNGYYRSIRSYGWADKAPEEMTFVDVGSEYFIAITEKFWNSLNMVNQHFPYNLSRSKVNSTWCHCDFPDFPIKRQRLKRSRFL